MNAFSRFEFHAERIAGSNLPAGSKARAVRSMKDFFLKQLEAENHFGGRLHKYLFATAGFLTVSHPRELDENFVAFFGAALALSLSVKALSRVVAKIKARKAGKIMDELAEKILSEERMPENNAPRLGA